QSSNYILERSTSVDTGFTTVYSGSNSDFTDNFNFVNGVTYYYRVQTCFNNVECGDFSNTFNYTKLNPDLSIESVTGNKNTYLKGDSVLIEFKVVNNIYEVTENFNLGFVLSLDDTVSQDDIRLDEQIEIGQTMDSVSSLAINYGFLLPDSIIGHWNILVIADVTNNIEEVNETNNLGIISIRVITPEEHFEMSSEFGTILANANNKNDWKTLNLTKSFKNPIVVFGGLSFGNSAPTGEVRIKNIDSNSFNYKIREWNYLDGVHANEQLNYIVIDSGEYILSSGKIIVGKTSANHLYSTVNINPANKLFFAQSQSHNNGSAITTRVKRNTNSFQVKVQEEENLLSSGHSTEIIGYVCIENGVNDITLGNHELKTRTISAKHKWKTIPNKTAIDGEVFIARMTSSNGIDPGNVRYRVTNTNRYKVRISEEKSKDKEIKHGLENISMLWFTPSQTNYKIENETIYEFDTKTTKTEFSIYPNPAKNEVNVVSESGLLNYKITFVDLLGVSVLDVNIQGGNNTPIDVSKLNNGYYQVLIMSEGKIYSQKLIIMN
ncbi:MAG: T9SS type A sorting domain-containing protein, partial [Flavobacteriales bacterium]